ncbi:multicopper oxidase domain-containing protein [Deinococcus yavapaiensis]|uniref:Copper-containing nitrite reductase n=1 Tax=Deinococcus yavapaiensis KR-236 TaxID=694435 RepID=A0A318S7K1_9DEIO|nr:multicopper oxidase domain-containing protein [Deinococcus yavapaiensis]PYE53876.1 copper-containing nitrite reductase [Deinococcus yavapaiensis KR-236]
MKHVVRMSTLSLLALSTVLAVDTPTPAVVTRGVATPATPMSVTPFDPLAPAQPQKGKIVEFKLEAKLAKLTLPSGETKEVWTFNNSVPGPVLRVHQGDTVRFTLTNRDPNMDHGLDFHAGQMDMGQYHKAIKPGESITFDWVAHYPGVFLYHCSAGPVIMHVANGMFGAVIVDPPGYTPKGKEYVLVQHEWYKNGTDLGALIHEEPEALAFNGIPAQYTTAPLTAKPNETVRLYFVNAGINNTSAFHVIGTIFDKVLLDGNPKNTLYGVQTVSVAPGGALVAELSAAAGSYAILSHSLRDAMKGALGILKVGEASSTVEESHGHMTGLPEQPSGAGLELNIENFAFSNKKIVVKAGTSVTWVNHENTLHTIVGANFDSRGELKDGLGKGDKFTVTFSKAGLYEYLCSLHPFMKGVVEVQ